MSGCANSRTRGVAGQNSQKSVDLLRPFTVLEIAPEMILDRRFARSSPFAHKTYFLRSSDMTLGDFHGGPRGFGAAVDFIFEAALARLSFVIETEHDIDHGHASINRDALQRIRDGAAQILRVVRFSLQNYATWR